MARETEETESTATRGKKKEKQNITKQNKKTPGEYLEPIRNRCDVRRRRTG
jgi:hypothetical protein